MEVCTTHKTPSLSVSYKKKEETNYKWLVGRQFMKRPRHTTMSQICVVIGKHLGSVLKMTLVMGNDHMNFNRHACESTLENKSED